MKRHRFYYYLVKIKKLVLIIDRKNRMTPFLLLSREDKEIISNYCMMYNNFIYKRRNYKVIYSHKIRFFKIYDFNLYGMRNNKKILGGQFFLFILIDDMEF